MVAADRHNVSVKHNKLVVIHYDEHRNPHWEAFVVNLNLIGDEPSHLDI